MKSDFFGKIKAAVSERRIEAYRRGGEQDIFPMARYLRNMALCESLYHSLQSVEIGLRNTMNHALSARFGNNWMQDGNVLLCRDRKAVDSACQVLAGRGKVQDPDALVAELSFGFWTTLLDRRYEHNQRLWPGLLKQAFPCMARRLRTRAVLSRRFNRIRTLRNRVFHHERIEHWTDLGRQHDDIVEAIAWISPQLMEMVVAIDRFPETGRQPLDYWIEIIRRHWPSG